MSTVKKLRTTFNFENASFSVTQIEVECDVFEYSHGKKLFDGQQLFPSDELFTSNMTYAGQNLTVAKGLTDPSIGNDMAKLLLAEQTLVNLEREVRLFPLRADYCNPRIAFLKKYTEGE